MTLTDLTGSVRFKVAGQPAMPKWMQTALADALDKAEAPPESLRFQCRIATDARENFSLINLPNGETLTLHPKARPQFGKNRDGHAFLTATLIYSGDGLGYRFRWIGNDVPQKMQEVAVKHDKGLAVNPVVVGLDLSKAEITPSWKVNGYKGPDAEAQRSRARREAGKIGQRDHDGKAKRGKRTCARLTDADL